MRISFIIPVYNAEKYIQSCLTALSDQGLGYDEFEVLIVNDGSTDGTLAAIEAMRGLVPQIRVLSTNRLGPGGARNVAIDQARGDRIWFVDADDIVIPGSAVALLRIMDEQALDLVSFEILRMQSGVNLKSLNRYDACRRPGPVRTGPDHLSSSHFRGESWWFISARKLHEGGPRYTPKIFCADTLFVPALILRASRAAHVDAVGYVYVLSDTSVTKQSNPAHLAKMADDMLFVSGRMREFSSEQASSGASTKLVRKLNSLADSLVFFLHVRLLRHAPPFAFIKEVHARARAARLIPLRHFGKPEYPRRRYAFLRFCINYPEFYLLAALIAITCRRLLSLFKRG